MMFTTSSLIVMALSVIAIVLANVRFDQQGREIPDSVHRTICIGAFAVGCVLRLFQLGTLPAGISAEEALVGMQAKSLWQTRGFLFSGGLTTQFEQWAGESTGPLLATITAPFVGLFGMTPWVVRLPLALLSCAAIPAAYVFGCELGGRRAGRWMLVIYALCPYFVLSARLTCGANAAICLLPIALCAMIKGFKKPVYAYVGAILMALMAYAQDIYFFIAPAVIAAASMIGHLRGEEKKHQIGAAFVGLLVCLPAMLTLWVNLCSKESFKWLDIVQIPMLESFDKADSLFDELTMQTARWEIRSKVWAVITGGIFQILEHMNISREMFAPTGMGALYIISLPLMFLGGFSLLHNWLEGKRAEKVYSAGRLLVKASAMITLFALIVYGSVGSLDREGCTSVFDYSALLIFDALLMAAGMCRMEKKSRRGTLVLNMLFSLCVVMLCMHLYGGGYQNNANVFFRGFAELSQKAARVQRDSGAKVNVTGNVYPHIAPSDAAEMMYLYAIDADMDVNRVRRGMEYDIIYAPGIEEPNSDEIYLIAQNDSVQWDYDAYNYEEIGEYILLTPVAE